MKRRDPIDVVIILLGLYLLFLIVYWISGLVIYSDDDPTQYYKP